MANNNNNNNANNWESLLTQQEKQVYSDFFKKVDADNKGIVLQDEAMSFFQKSDVPKNILEKFWEASDNDRKGFLTEQEFCTVLKFIACAQNGVMPNDSSILATSVGLPHFNGNGHSGMVQPQQQQQTGSSTVAPPPLPTNRPLGGVNANPDLVTPEDRAKYISLFQSFGAENNILSGEKARDAFMRSNLPPEILQRVWSLADTRQSGSLNQTEFIIAMHYIERCMKGQGPLPPSLPPAVYASATGRQLHASPLVRHNTLATTTATTPAAVGGGGGIPRNVVASPVFKGAPLPSQQANVIDISLEEYNKYKVFFDQLNVNNSGFISGADAVVFFKHSKLDDSDLARIWDVADTDSTGQLSAQEFALAMHLINRRVAGGDIPSITPQVRIGGTQLLAAPIQQQQQQQQQQQPIADLLGLSSDMPSTAIPTSPQQQPLQQQQKPNFSSNNTADLAALESNIQQENNRHQQAQSQYHLESQAVQELERQIASQKEALAKIKQEAEEAEKQLAAEKEKKESLTKELQMYRQEIKHFSTRAENAKAETEQVKKEIEGLEKEKNQKVTTTTATSPIFNNSSINNINSSSPTNSQSHHDNNVFTLSTATPGSLFAKVVENKEASTAMSPQTMSPSTSSQKAYDPFAGFKAHQTKVNSPTLSANSLNHLKEESEKKKAANASPSVDISDIESKFPDLSTMEQNFAMPSATSPTLSTTSASQKQNTAMISSPKSVASTEKPTLTDKPSESLFTPSSGHLKDNIFGIYDKSKTTTSDNNNNTLSSEKPPSSSVSKYGFDLSAFEPSTSSTTAGGGGSNMSVKDELSSLFGGSQTEDNNNNSNNNNKPAPSFSDAFSVTSATPNNDKPAVATSGGGFDDIFGAPATTATSANKSNSFEDIFFQK